MSITSVGCALAGAFAQEPQLPQAPFLPDGRQILAMRFNTTHAAQATQATTIRSCAVYELIENTSRETR